VVTEAETSEINAPLFDYLRMLAIAAVVIVVAVVTIAFFSASRLLRPIGPIVEAANKVGHGDLDVRLPDAGRDEFAYVSGQFNKFVDELTRRNAELRATEAETSELLASVVPRRLVDKVMAGDRDIAESMSNASLIAFTFKGAAESLKNLEDLAEQNAELITGLSALAERYGAEQLSSSAVTVLYATGLDVADPRIEDAAEFAAQASDWMSETLRARGFMIDASVGIASGDLVTGVMGTERLTVDVLGVPRQVAGVLSGVAEPRQVLVDAEVAGRLGDDWQVERVSDLKDLSGSSIDAWKVTRSLV
jgi:HAMP domain-containing protein